MKYTSGKRRRAIEYEKALTEWWKKNKIFEKSVEQRPVHQSYVFYDGPPFITGMPHHGTLLSSVVKDAVPRFWTMRGYRVERRWGWDCHGLPAENFVEKQLGITDRREIGTKWSLEEYINKARESMVAHSETWEGTIDRIGRWVDFKGAYRTMDKDFMESVWWAFKTLYEAGKIYEGRKVLMYDTKFATPVSKSEVTMDNDAYQEVTDPSAYVLFEVKKPIKSYLMGVGEIDNDLKELGVEFKKDNSNYLVTLKPEQLEGYERLVEAKMQPEYWNEYVDNGQVTFLFKMSDGKVERYTWVGEDNKNEDQIGKLIEQFSGSFSGVKDMLENNEWYGKGILSSAYLLAWTTTPWTLPANMALAVNPDLEYVTVRVDGKVLILAKSRLGAVLKDVGYEIVGEGIKGNDLIGLTYEPICATIDREAKLKDTWTVLGGDFVSDADGTGIVHIAPAYGEDDYRLSQEHEVDFVDVLDEYGYYDEKTAEWLHNIGVRDTSEEGIEIWAGNKFIAKCLEEKGIVWKIEYIKHEYPFNPRSKQRIMYRAFPSWFFDIQGQKPLMLEKNEDINWFPNHFKHGRFAKNIEQAPDWNLSRDRFWATAMPVWKGERTGAIKVFGSYAELKELSGVELDDYHRPWVDEIEFDAAVTADGEVLSPDESSEEAQLDHFKRVDKVLDCWFESGSMPFAQLHYPFENKEKFERNYPADFIVEYVGQVRAWFYYVHAVNTALAEVGAFGEKARESGDYRAYKNVIVTGTLAGNDGRKMSKSLGNYTDPNVLMDEYSADALRFLMLSSPVLAGEDFALIDKDVSDVARKLAMIWNVYDFFTMYAGVDGWESPEMPGKWGKDLENPLDRWIISRLHQLRKEVIDGMEAYDIPRALVGVLPFVDDLSNWFVRRSRRRFWKSEDDNDKAEAYWTLWKVLSNLARILAPFTPFLAEELWQNVVGGGPENSVHLQGFPTTTDVDQEVIDQMSRVREVINEGLRLRMYKDEHEQQVKVRQPLTKLVYEGAELPEWGIEIVKDEVNVKDVEQGDKTWIDKELTEELKREGWSRELVRSIQSARKKACLNVDDRIRVSVSVEVPEEWREMVKAETLADELTENQNYAYDEIVKVEGENVTISLEKVV